jgi:hypothetical protein
MRVSELLLTVPDGDALVFLDFSEQGPWGTRSPDTVLDLVQDQVPADTIIEQRAVGTPIVRASEFRSQLARQDPSSAVQLYLRTAAGQDHYFSLSRVRFSSMGAIYLMAGPL